MRHCVPALTFLVVALMAFTALLPATADIGIVNGGFEDGNMTGWSTGYWSGTVLGSGAPPYNGLFGTSSADGVSINTYAKTDTYGAFFGNNASSYSGGFGLFNYGATSSTGVAWGIYQTNALTIAEGDTISFDYRAFVNNRPADSPYFEAGLISGSNFVTLASQDSALAYQTTTYVPPAATANNYQWITASHTVTHNEALQLAGSAYLGFFAYNQPALQGYPPYYVNLDNVSLDRGEKDNGSGGTPELGTFALMGLSMLPMAGVAIRRRRKAA